MHTQVTSSITKHKIQAERLTLVGGVQGFGIRPAIARLASDLELKGTVRNAMQGVVIELEGSETAVDEFRTRLRKSLSQIANLVNIDREAIECKGYDRFSIEASDPIGQPDTAVPVDLNICSQCLADLRNPHSRRSGYAFTTCTDCGPRFSILQSMPYDRERTSMKRFTMCELCIREYSSAQDRRFHSQSNSCPDCGPKLWFSKDGCESSQVDAVELAADCIRGGGILALKGLGGYQLLCDATNEDAVRHMRERKHRPTKPLAMMVNALGDVARFAILSSSERQAIQSPPGPIVLLETRAAAVLAPSIHSGLNTIGIMLPTTALHALLMDRCRIPLIVTSGNVEGEPLVYRIEDAEKKLYGLADAYLHHDREIVHPVDDSVVRCMNDRIVTIRAARGLTPISVNLQSSEPLLAVGGQQKGSIALSNGRQAVLCSHLGDLASVASREYFDQHVADMQSLYEVNPVAIAHDKHPDYFSTRWALATSIPCHSVQHHHAHVVSGMLEHGWLDETVLGIAFDGTGWSDNGEIWGGEIVLASATDYERIGSLRPFSLLGGEAAIREPHRIAIALLKDAMGFEFDEAIDVLNLRSRSMSLNSGLFEQSRFSPWTTSAGRLFDGVAAMGMGDIRPDYEGELAMRWEAICDRQELGAYSFVVGESLKALRAKCELQNGYATSRSQAPAWERTALEALPPDSTRLESLYDLKALGERWLLGERWPVGEPRFAVDWRPMIREMVLDFKRGVSSGVIAMRFHRGLAIAIAAVVDQFPDYRVVLSGGVFQNRLLVELLEPLLTRACRNVGWPGRIPPNDGGLSIGQLAVAAARNRLPSAAKQGLKDKAPLCV